MAFPFSRKKKSTESPSKKKLKPGQAVKLVTPKKSKKPKRTVTWANTKGGNLEKVKQYNKNTKLTSEIKKSNNEKNTKTENINISFLFILLSLFCNFLSSKFRKLETF